MKQFDNKYIMYIGKENGYLKIPKQKVIDLKLTDVISFKSFMDSKFVYIEEERDLRFFIEELLIINNIRKFSKGYLNFLKDFWSNIEVLEDEKKVQKIKTLDTYKHISKEEEIYYSNIRTEMLKIYKEDKNGCIAIEKASNKKLDFWKVHFKIK